VPCLEAHTVQEMSSIEHFLATSSPAHYFGRDR
jgi:hypothetical protein